MTVQEYCPIGLCSCRGLRLRIGLGLLCFRRCTTALVLVLGRRDNYTIGLLPLRCSSRTPVRALSPLLSPRASSGRLGIQDQLYRCRRCCRCLLHSKSSSRLMVDCTDTCNMTATCAKQYVQVLAFSVQFDAYNEILTVRYRYTFTFLDNFRITKPVPFLSSRERVRERKRIVWLESTFIVLLLMPKFNFSKP